MKRFVLGDVHGRIEALKDVLQQSQFDYNNDKLIVLGDIVDGGFNTFDVVEELLKIKNLIFIIGNHDVFFINYIKTGCAEHIWINQGGANTINSYGGIATPGTTILANFFLDASNLKVPDSHKDFFNKGVYYYVEDEMLFVHGGFDPFTKKTLDEQGPYKLTWDRDIINIAKKNLISKYKYIFIGHTATQTIKKEYDLPLNYNNLWCLDTGAGWDGFLTIMNVDTLEFWQSKIQTPAI